MSEPSRSSRREFLRAAVALGGASLAGCTAPADDGDDEVYVPVEPNYRGWFDGVGNYDRTIDARDRDAITVGVGVQGDLGYYKFGPPAIAVSPGTPITWEWTGRGGTHNVVADQGAFHSGELVDQEGYTFEHTLEEPAIYKYVCEPHRSLGMKGAIYVTLE